MFLHKVQWLSPALQFQNAFRHLRRFYTIFSPKCISYSVKINITRHLCCKKLNCVLLAYKKSNFDTSHLERWSRGSKSRGKWAKGGGGIFLKHKCLVCIIIGNEYTYQLKQMNLHTWTADFWVLKSMISQQ